MSLSRLTEAPVLVVTYLYIIQCHCQGSLTLKVPSNLGPRDSVTRFCHGETQKIFFKNKNKKFFPKIFFPNFFLPQFFFSPNLGRVPGIWGKVAGIWGCLAYWGGLSGIWGRGVWHMGAHMPNTPPPYMPDTRQMFT